jgi:PAS domain S-box-containing protein
VVELGDVLMTDALYQRPSGPRDVQAQLDAFDTLARCMAEEPDQIVDRLGRLALELCRAGSAGVSVLETSREGKTIFRWATLAGKFAPYIGGSTPRDWSPCGTCLDRGGPTLFSHPARFFEYLHQADPAIVEGLVIPMSAQGRAAGTIWVLAHDEEHKFDLEDVRILTSLANFTAAAIQMSAEIRERKRLSAESAFQASLLSQVRNAVIATDLEGNITHWNTFAEDIYQWKAAEVIGKNIGEVTVPPEEQARSRQVFGALARSGYWEGEFRVQRKDGARFPAFVTDSVVKDEAGAPIGYVGVSADISDRKRVERELLLSNRRLNLISETAGLLLSEREPRSAVQSVYSKLSSEFGLSLYVNYLVSDDGCRLRLDSYQGLTEELARQVEWVEFGQEKKISDFGCRISGVSDFICYPLLANNRLIGAIAFGAKERGKFEPEDLDLIQTLVNQLAVALDRIQLHSQLALRASLINLSPDAIIVRKTDGTILQWNSGAESIYGWTEAEAVHKICNQVLRAKFSVPPEEVHRALQESGRWDGELVHTCKDGSEVVIESRKA